MATRRNGSAVQQSAPTAVEDPETTDASDVDDYEHGPIGPINAELRKHGIDPTSTIRRVTQLVKSKAAEWRRGRAVAKSS